MLPSTPLPTNSPPAGLSGLHTYEVNQDVIVEVANHPPRADSAAYIASRNWLMGNAAGGCFICAGPVDLSHPPTPGSPEGMEDHHGGGLFIGDTLIGLGLLSLEWSAIWGSDPIKVEAIRVARNSFLALVNQPTYDSAIKTVDDVSDFADSVQNANVKLCHVHHVGTTTEHTPDANGNEAVGIHECPLPMFVGQATWDWSQGDYFGGTTGTIAVGKLPNPPGAAVVAYVSSDYPDKTIKTGDILRPDHKVAMAAHTPRQIGKR